MLSDPAPSWAFQPVRPAVGSGSKELPPQGLHLARSSIWPKLREVKPRSWVQLWHEPMQFKASCFGSGGTGAKKILPLGQLQNEDFAMCLYTEFLSLLCSGTAMHLETLHNCFIFIQLTENRITHLLRKQTFFIALISWSLIMNQRRKLIFLIHRTKISMIMMLWKLQKLDFSSITKDYCKLQTSVIMKSCIAIRKLAHCINTCIHSRLKLHATGDTRKKRRC